MIKLLILSAGTNACYHFAKILKQKFNQDFYIIGADINEQYLIPSFNYIDKFYKVPYSSDSNFYDTIIDICKHEKANYLLSSIDEDQNLFYPENDDLLALNVKSLSTPKETLKFYKNKKLMTEKLLDLKFPVPKIYTEKELKDNITYCIKPINGVGSVGIRYLCKDEIIRIKNIENYLIEELCTKPEITLECFHYQNKISTIARQRIETKAGVCTKSKIFYDKDLENIAKKFVKKIKCPLFFNLQFMKNSFDKFVITDINLRLAGGMGLSYATGWDEVSAVANVLLGENINKVFSSLNPHKQIAYVVRTYTDIMTKCDNNTIAFDLDGTILNNFERHTIVLKNALKQFNIDLDLSDYIEFKRQGRNNIQYLLSKNIDFDIATKIQKHWIKNIEKEEFLNKDFLYPKIEKKLSKLSKKNKLILITARNNKLNCEKQIKRLQLDSYFSEIFIVKSNSNTCKLKAEILQNCNVFSMIGDTEVDKQACKLAGVKFEPVYYGFRNRKVLNKNNEK